MVPSISDPIKYDGMPNTVTCKNCQKPIKLNQNEKPQNGNIYNLSCPNCNARFSYPVTDKSWSSYGQTPGTLNEGMGSNSDMPGYGYHPGANSNQDTFSSNLGK
jgi:hypothetical protein